MRYLRIWWRARFRNYPFWRVYYKDGSRTFLLYYREAKGLAETFNGKLVIDYTINLKDWL
jgi:hypothetical protein